jgi:hypothetical protein
MMNVRMKAERPANIISHTASRVDEGVNVEQLQVGG